MIQYIMSLLGMSGQTPQTNSAPVGEPEVIINIDSNEREPLSMTLEQRCQLACATTKSYLKSIHSSTALDETQYAMFKAHFITNQENQCHLFWRMVSQCIGRFASAASLPLMLGDFAESLNLAELLLSAQVHGRLWVYDQVQEWLWANVRRMTDEHRALLTKLRDYPPVDHPDPHVILELLDKRFLCTSMKMPYYMCLATSPLPEGIILDYFDKLRRMGIRPSSKDDNLVERIIGAGIPVSARLRYECEKCKQ